MTSPSSSVSCAGMATIARMVVYADAHPISPTRGRSSRLHDGSPALLMTKCLYLRLGKPRPRDGQAGVSTISYERFEAATARPPIISLTWGCHAFMVLAPHGHGAFTSCSAVSPPTIGLETILG